MVANRGVLLELMATSGAALIISTVTRGSLMRAFMSEMNSSALVPGRRRQSRDASAVDGITLDLGGEPTPDVRVVSEMVFRWIAEVNLFTTSGTPIARFISSTTGFCFAGSGSARAFSI